MFVQVGVCLKTWSMRFTQKNKKSVGGSVELQVWSGFGFCCFLQFVAQRRKRRKRNNRGQMLVIYKPIRHCSCLWLGHKFCPCPSKRGHLVAPSCLYNGFMVTYSEHTENLQCMSVCWDFTTYSVDSIMKSKQKTNNLWFLVRKKRFLCQTWRWFLWCFRCWRDWMETFKFI